MSAATSSVNISGSSGDDEGEEEEETCQRGEEEDPEEGGSGKVEQLVERRLFKRNALKSSSREDYRSLNRNVSRGDGKGSHQSVEEGPEHAPNPRHLPQTRAKRHVTAALSKHSSITSLTGADLFWEEVRSQSQSQTHAPSLPDEEEEEEEEEAGSAALEVRNQTVMAVSSAERRMKRKEKKRIKTMKRRKRRREKMRQSQQRQENMAQKSSGDQSTSSSSSSSSSSSEEDEALHMKNKERYICAVCLDVYFSPHMCRPCNHVFCEPCLRTLAKNNPSTTPCPLCRTTITHVFFQKELNQRARTLFPGAYLTRKQNFQKASCAKWPLPSCRKLFRIFGGFQRHSSPITGHQLAPGSYRLNSIDFGDDSRGWRFDMDPVIIYIYSVNWIIGFLIFCFLCFLFFPSF